MRNLLIFVFVLSSLIISAQQDFDVLGVEPPSIEAVKTVEITNDVAPLGASLGDTITYTIIVENTGGYILDGVGIVDTFIDANGNSLTLLTGPSFVSADQGSLEGDLLLGEVATYTATYVIEQDAVDAGGISNSVLADCDAFTGVQTNVDDVSDDGDDLDGNTEDDPTETTIREDPSIEAVKTVVITNDVVPVGASLGDMMTYTITVTNTGNVTLDGVAIADTFVDANGNALTLLTGPTFVSANQGSLEGGLLVGEVATYTATYVIEQDAINAGGFRNSVLASGDSPSDRNVEDTSDDGDDLDGNTTDDPTETLNIINLCINDTIAGTVTANDPDADGINNVCDLDDDNDGILDAEENRGIDPLLDSDTDGTLDYLDDDTAGYIDSNGDNVDDRYDTDLDGTIDQFDLDSDNDGIPDNIEAQTTAGYVAPSGTINPTSGVDTNYTGGLTPVNTDFGAASTDTVPDYLDTDSDNDGLSDTVEAGYTLASSTTDTDNDGLLDDYDDIVGPDVNDDINDPNPSTLQDSDFDISSNGDSAIPLINDLDYRDDTPFPPFVCDDTLYLGQSPNNTTAATLYELDTSINPFTTASIGDNSHGIRYNAIGLNPLDGYLYGIERNTNVLIKVASNGSVIRLGAVPGLPFSGSYLSGDIDDNGNLYLIKIEPANLMYTINLSSLAVTSIALSQTVGISDLAYNINDGLIYAVNQGSGANAGALVIITPLTGNVSFVGSYPIEIFAAMFTSSTGEIYGNSNSGGFYQFNLTTGERTLISDSPGAYSNDGAHCVTEPMTFEGDLQVTKTDGISVYANGETITYTIVVSNNGPYGVAGATVSDLVPSGIPTENVSYTAVASVGASTSVAGTQIGDINDTVNLPVGGVVTYTVSLIVPSGFTANIENTATVTSPINFTDTDPTNNSATDINVFADNDNDSVNDTDDLDDDNDGILDTNECPLDQGTFSGGQTGTVSNGTASANYELVQNVLVGYNGDTITSSASTSLEIQTNIQNGGNDVMNYTINLTSITPGYKAVVRLYQRVGSTEGNAHGSNYTMSWLGASGTARYSDAATPTTGMYAFGIPTGFDINNGQIEGIATSGIVNNGDELRMYSIRNRDVEWYIEFPIGASSITVDKRGLTGGTSTTEGIDHLYPRLGYLNPNASGETYDEWITFQVYFVPDTDNDGVVDCLDLDSDNDGCNDVIESSGIDTNNDGVLDGTGFDSNGLVTGGTGGYNGVTGNEIQAVQLIVDTLPTNQTENIGNAASFTAVATADAATSYTSGTPNYGTPGNANAGVNYQWYLGDPDSGGSIIDGTDPNYTNYTTGTLNIADVTGLDGTQYCVLITHNDNVCIRVVNCATLSTEDPCIDGAIVGTVTANDPDADGINNICDLDDDNDGILDTNECPLDQGTFSGGQTGTVSNGNASANYELVQNTLVGYAGDVITSSVSTSFEIEASGQPGGNDVMNYTLNLTNISPGYKAVVRLYQRVGSNGGNSHGSNYTMSWLGASGYAQYSDPATPTTEMYVRGIPIGFDINNGQIEGLATSGIVNNGGELRMYSIRNRDVEWYIEFPIGASSITVDKRGLTGGTSTTEGIDHIYPQLGYLNSNTSGETFNEWITFQVYFVPDTDNDGVVDCLDLDSDNDGCNDVIESSGIDTNNDGVLDGTGFDSNGLVTGGTGGYNGVTGNEIQAVQLIVDTLPTNQTEDIGNAASFTAVATADAATSYTSGTPNYGTPGNANAGVNYQWYLGDPDSGGSIIDGTDPNYTNYTTGTLNIADVTGLDGTQYCVLITHNDNVCIRVVNCATLTTEDPIYDLAVTKVVDVLRPAVGAQVIFTIEVTNIGKVVATDIVISEQIPSGYMFVSAITTAGTYSEFDGEWIIDQLNPNQAEILEITVEVLRFGDHLNTAFISSSVGGPDDNPGNDEDDAIVYPICLKIYNEFSPNGDGANETFVIDCLERFPDNKLEVYNRWGNMVYSKKDYLNDWEGTPNAKVGNNQSDKLPVGTYYYVLDLGDGSEPRVGWLYINK